MIVPIPAMAGLPGKPVAPAGPGTFPWRAGTFIVLLLGTVLLVGVELPGPAPGWLSSTSSPAVDNSTDRRHLHAMTSSPLPAGLKSLGPAVLAVPQAIRA